MNCVIVVGANPPWRLVPFDYAQEPRSVALSVVEGSKGRTIAPISIVHLVLVRLKPALGIMERLTNANFRMLDNFVRSVICDHHFDI